MHYLRLQASVARIGRDIFLPKTALSENGYRLVAAPAPQIHYKSFGMCGYFQGSIRKEGTKEATPSKSAKGVVSTSGPFLDGRWFRGLCFDPARILHAHTPMPVFAFLLGTVCAGFAEASQVACTDLPLVNNGRNGLSEAWVAK